MGSFSDGWGRYRRKKEERRNAKWAVFSDGWADTRAMGRFVDVRVAMRKILGMFHFLYTFGHISKLMIEGLCISQPQDIMLG